MFFSSICRPRRLTAVKAFFAHQAASQQLDLMPVVQGRFISINGQQVDQMKGQHPFRFACWKTRSLPGPMPLDGDKVIEGGGGRAALAEIAMNDGVAQRLHQCWRGLRSRAADRRTTRPQSSGHLSRRRPALGARVQFVLPSGLVSEQPSTWYGGVHINPKQAGAMERSFFVAYPQPLPLSTLPT